MAKIKLGLIVSDVRGAVGGVILSRNKSGAYMRKNTSPTNPSTPSQAEVRSVFGSLSSAWKGLTAEERDAWKAAAESKQYNRTNQLGIVVQPSGFQLFCRLNGALLQNDFAMINRPGPKSEFPAITAGNMVLEASGGLLDTGSIAYSGTLGSFNLITLASPSQSAGTSSPVTMKKVALHPGSTPVDFASGYNNTYGFASVGSRIFVSLTLLDPDTGETFEVGKNSGLVIQAP